jgi:hypothetical protein
MHDVQLAPPSGVEFYRTEEIDKPLDPQEIETRLRSIIDCPSDLTYEQNSAVITLTNEVIIYGQNVLGNLRHETGTQQKVITGADIANDHIAATTQSHRQAVGPHAAQSPSIDAPRAHREHDITARQARVGRRQIIELMQDFEQWSDHQIEEVDNLRLCLEPLVLAHQQISQDIDLPPILSQFAAFMEAHQELVAVGTHKALQSFMESNQLFKDFQDKGLNGYRDARQPGTIIELFDANCRIVGKAGILTGHSIRIAHATLASAAKHLAEIQATVEKFETDTTAQRPGAILPLRNVYSVTTEVASKVGVM